MSVWNGMEDALEAIVHQQPASVLDAGIGFGLWGALLRQYLDVWPGRLHPQQWRVRIDGIELDERRVLRHARDLYDDIEIGDIRDVVPRRAAAIGYDVILFGDVIEHLPKPDGVALLGHATRLAQRLVVVRLPLGDGWRREGPEPPDDHRSQWYVEDFGALPCEVRQYSFAGNPYGLVTIAAGESRDPAAGLDEIAGRLAALEQRVERLVRPLC